MAILANLWCACQEQKRYKKAGCKLVVCQICGLGNGTPSDKTAKNTAFYNIDIGILYRERKLPDVLRYPRE